MRVTINMDDDLHKELLELSRVMNRSLSGQIVHLSKTHPELVGKKAWDRSGHAFDQASGPVKLSP